MLEIRNLEAGYGKMQVLFGINLVVNPNEIVVLIGPNGAGKTTVLKSIFKFADVCRGEIVFKNKSLLQLHTHDLISLGIGYVPQGRQVFRNLTVNENLEMGAFLTPDKDLIAERIEEVLNHFPELRPKLNTSAASLPGGQQQMLAVARALMQDPQLLLMDEPSLGLSPKVTDVVMRKIVDIRNEGTAVLLAEQNAKKATTIADRIYVLDDGKVALHGGREVLKHKEIQSIYLGGR